MRCAAEALQPTFLPVHTRVFITKPFFEATFVASLSREAGGSYRLARAILFGDPFEDSTS